jgi:endonuclease III
LTLSGAQDRVRSVMAPTRPARPSRPAARRQTRGRRIGSRRIGRRPSRSSPAGPPPEPADARARRAQEIARRLADRYPRAAIPLRHRTPLQLLIATILSAQSTDEQVNKVTPALFARYKTAADFAGAPREELETLIHSTGFFHAKARAIQNAARMILAKFGGDVPKTMEELVQLPGVGRKTANVVLSRFGVPGIVVDTHVRRLSRRLGLTAHSEPDKIEQDVMALLLQSEWSAFSLRLIYFGREVCTARRPQCPTCPLRDLCPSARYLGAPPWMAPRTVREGVSAGGAAARLRGRRGRTSGGISRR